MPYDGAVLDRQFNNRELVPDWTEWVRRWRLASQDARLDLPCQLDLRYGPDLAQTLDWFPAAGATPAPCLVFIHGGWWRAFDKADHSFVAPPFVRRGAHVAVINYRLAPGARLDAIAQDVIDALAWIWRQAGNLAVDRSRIVLAGHSAGAHLAALMLACRFDQAGPDLPAQLPSGVLAISGVYDLEAVRVTPFLQRDLHLTRALAQSLSPVRKTPAGPAPLYLAVGSDESPAFHDQARRMRKAWPAHTSDITVLDGCHHFAVLDALAEGEPAHALLADLLGLPEPAVALTAAPLAPPPVAAAPQRRRRPAALHARHR